MLVFINWAFCSMVGWACVCRFSSMSGKTTRSRFRIGYVVLFMAATMSGFSWVLFGEWPGPGQIAMAAAWVALLGVNAGNWRHGTPDYARSDRMPLDTVTESQWAAIIGRGKD